MLFRGEMSKRICFAFAVTERKETHTLREKEFEKFDLGQTGASCEPSNKMGELPSKAIVMATS